MEKKHSIDKGFIKLYRSIENNKFYFAEPFTYMGAWIDLLLLANHQDRTFNVRGNFITAKRGEVGYSRESLAKRWKWSRGKVNRFLDKLEMEQQIVQQKSHILSIIQINNYDKFQINRTADSTTDGQQTVQQTVQQTDTNKNDKKEKNVKKEITYSSEFESVWKDYPSSRREDKASCLKYWNKIPEDKKESFYLATKKYISENSRENYKYVKKSHRWFKDWETQIETIKPIQQGLPEDFDPLGMMKGKW